jgi:hypothetical protein
MWDKALVNRLKALVCTTVCFFLTSRTITMGEYIDPIFRGIISHYESKMSGFSVAVLREQYYTTTKFRDFIEQVFGIEEPMSAPIHLQAPFVTEDVTQFMATIGEHWDSNKAAAVIGDSFWTALLLSNTTMRYPSLRGTNQVAIKDRYESNEIQWLVAELIGMDQVMLKRNNANLLRTKTMASAFEALITFFVNSYDGTTVRKAVEQIVTCMDAIIARLKSFENAHVKAATSGEFLQTPIDLGMI